MLLHDVSRRQIHWNSFCPLRTGSNCAMSFISATELWCVSGVAPKGPCFTVNELQPQTRGGRISPSCLFCGYSAFQNFMSLQLTQILYHIHTTLFESKGTSLHPLPFSWLTGLTVVFSVSLLASWLIGQQTFQRSNCNYCACRFVSRSLLHLFDTL